MKLNQKVRYGVACLYELSKIPGEYIDADYISTHQNIPPAYTHKILQTLANAGFVFPQKGVGYKLARSLSEITAFEIIDVLTSNVDPSSSNPDMGILLEDRINKELGNFTLEDLTKTKQ